MGERDEAWVSREEDSEVSREGGRGTRRRVRERRRRGREMGGKLGREVSTCVRRGRSRSAGGRSLERPWSRRTLSWGEKVGRRGRAARSKAGAAGEGGGGKHAREAVKREREVGEAEGRRVERKWDVVGCRKEAGGEEGRGRVESECSSVLRPAGQRRGEGE